MQRAFLYILVAVFLAGCATKSSVNSANFSELNKYGNGIVVLSSTVRLENPNSLLSIFRPGNRTEWQQKGGSGFYLITKENTSGGTGAAAYEVPPGTYSLRQYGINNGKLYVQGNIGLKDVVTFNVRVGEVVYLGNLEVHTYEKHPDGSTKFKAVVTDEYDEAKKLVGYKFPEFAKKMKKRFMKVH